MSQPRRLNATALLRCSCAAYTLEPARSADKAQKVHGNRPAGPQASWPGALLTRSCHLCRPGVLRTPSGLLERWMPPSQSACFTCRRVGSDSQGLAGLGDGHIGAGGRLRQRTRYSAITRIGRLHRLAGAPATRSSRGRRLRGSGSHSRKTPARVFYNVQRCQQAPLI